MVRFESDSLSIEAPSYSALLQVMQAVEEIDEGSMLPGSARCIDREIQPVGFVAFMNWAIDLGIEIVCP
jgi:hypothetical protein